MHGIHDFASSSMRHSRRTRLSRRMIAGGIFLVLFAVGSATTVLFFDRRGKSELDDKEVLGAKSFAEGNFEESVQYLEEAGDEKSTDNFLKLAVAYYNKRDYEHALMNYEKVVEMEPENYTAYNGMGNLYRDRKEYEKAEEHYRKAIAIKSDYTLAYSNLAIMYMDKGDLAKAKTLLDEGLAKTPDSPELRNIRSSIGKEE